ncbi:RnfABCDGE type electron transport complex subunit B [Candidatus Endoriftia persephone]|jgi:Na+-translocating ferredoxin:NAD+ oxidoreductase RNF subunit RnfB|uniref:Ion-translocating oxidoreductase complex subunit B n=3 Tax=Gammaproteobacteria TaxID=1236 RepID=G2FI93_9GAMM|nr:RnfABCDGE type electron transport complex subunit B [Candidatus Endoriftia persephone]EGW53446.1 electron transport complex, RnfABCDGE type, B subunit subfamily [endosymbiont of Tevnia jerichonana (vent Tica)]USF87611.1 RnfABCDGE type electron transport complex subunit B [Candidatus Endoriftia persephone]
MSELLSSFVSSAGIMTGIGLFFGIILAVAYRFLKVEEDPRIATTDELLPGTNCGACGEPGCLPFAEALVAGKAQPSGCTVADEATIDAIADFLDVDAGQADKQVARLRCAGGKAQAFQIAEYAGFEGCRAAATVSGGGKGCSWGCLGLADCKVACDFDAIHMNANGLPQVDVEKCTACGDCVEACPKDLFELLPLTQKLYVQCNNPLEGEAVTVLCSVGCDACGKCAADAAPGLITMSDNLPLIDLKSGAPMTDLATRRCPTAAIQWLEDGQFIEQQSAQAESEKRYARLH